jgi:hypothetical protein
VGGARIAGGGYAWTVGPIDANGGKDARPSVRTEVHDGVPYLKVLGLLDEPVLDLTCVEALNLAMELIEHGGRGLAQRIAPHWP